MDLPRYTLDATGLSSIDELDPSVDKQSSSSSNNVLSDTNGMVTDDISETQTALFCLKENLPELDSTPIPDSVSTSSVLETNEQTISMSAPTLETCDLGERPTSNNQKIVMDMVFSEQTNVLQSAHTESVVEPGKQELGSSSLEAAEPMAISAEPMVVSVERMAVSDLITDSGATAELASANLVSELEITPATPNPCLPKQAPVDKDSMIDQASDPSPMNIDIVEQPDPVPTQAPLEVTITNPFQFTHVKVPSNTPPPVLLPKGPVPTLNTSVQDKPAIQTPCQASQAPASAATSSFQGDIDIPRPSQSYWGPIPVPTHCSIQDNVSLRHSDATSPIPSLSPVQNDIPINNFQTSPVSLSVSTPAEQDNISNQASQPISQILIPAPIPSLEDNIADQASQPIPQIPIPAPNPSPEDNIAGHAPRSVSQIPVPALTPSLQVEQGNIADQAFQSVSQIPVPAPAPSLEVEQGNIADHASRSVSQIPVPAPTPSLEVEQDNIADHASRSVSQIPVPAPTPSLQVEQDNIADQGSRSISQIPVPAPIPLEVEQDNIADQASRSISQIPIPASSPSLEVEHNNIADQTSRSISQIPIPSPTPSLEDNIADQASQSVSHIPVPAPTPSLDFEHNIANQASQPISQIPVPSSTPSLEDNIADQASQSVSQIPVHAPTPSLEFEHNIANQASQPISQIPVPSPTPSLEVEHNNIANQASHQISQIFTPTATLIPSLEQDKTLIQTYQSSHSISHTLSSAQDTSPIQTYQASQASDPTLFPEENDMAIQSPYYPTSQVHEPISVTASSEQGSIVIQTPRQTFQDSAPVPTPVRMPPSVPIPTSTLTSEQDNTAIQEPCKPSQAPAPNASVENNRPAQTYPTFQASVPIRIPSEQGSATIQTPSQASEAPVSVPAPSVHGNTPIQTWKAPIPRTTPFPVQSSTPIHTSAFSKPTVNTIVSSSSKGPLHVDTPVIPLVKSPPSVINMPSPMPPSIPEPSAKTGASSQVCDTSEIPIRGKDHEPVNVSTPVDVVPWDPPLISTSAMSTDPITALGHPLIQSHDSDKRSITDTVADIPMETAENGKTDTVPTSVHEQITPAGKFPKEDEAIRGAPVQVEQCSKTFTGPQTLKSETTVAKPAPIDTQESQEPKLPQDAPPSMDDDSLDTMGKDAIGQQAINPMTVAPLTEEPMEVETLMGTPVTACSSEDNSKDVPPQDFKPFSNYTEDGKLIANGDGQSLERAASTGLDTEPMSSRVESSAEPNSVDDSFPGASDSVKSQPMSMHVASQFQNQFMDFLKCNDNATQHSFTGGTTNSGENSANADGAVTPTTVDPAPGEPMIGGEVTADAEVTTGSQVPDDGSQSCPLLTDEGSQSAVATPRTGKKRGRKKKSEIEAQRLAAAAVEGEMPKPARTLRKRKPKEPEKAKEDEEGGDDTNGKKKTCSPGLVPSTLPAEKLFEYQWPQQKTADWFFLQEHLSSFLGVKSFKRKYPDLMRRPVGMPERNFLQESSVVSEMQCDLGLTSLKSDQVYELLLKDFPEKYKQYAQVLREREHTRVAERKRLALELAKSNKCDLDVVKRAVRSAAEFNAQFMREKREERRAYFDLQTNEIHYPQSTRTVLPPEATKVGAYPVSLIPGQFQEYFKRYTSAQMKYFPLSTAIYDPPKHLDTIYADPNDKYESELDSQSASSQGDNGGSSSSGSSSGSGSDSDSDSSSEAAEPEVVMPAPPPTKKQGRTPRGKKQVPVPKGSGSVCNICQGSSEKNKIGETEELVKCAECGRHGHPSCLELTEEMIPNIKTYSWQCMECKTCVECMDPYDEDKMMFCDHCDRGYHTFCVGLRSIPTGRWECPSCRPEPAAKKRRR